MKVKGLDSNTKDNILEFIFKLALLDNEINLKHTFVFEHTYDNNYTDQLKKKMNEIYQLLDEYENTIQTLEEVTEPLNDEVFTIMIEQYRSIYHANCMGVEDLESFVEVDDI